MNILVTGGRDWNHPQLVHNALDMLYRHYPITGIIHAAASGVDSAADDWVLISFVKRYQCPAYWNDYGPRAGPLRNSQMLLGPAGPYQTPRPEYCVASL